MKKKSAAKPDKRNVRIVKELAEIFRWLERSHVDLLPLFRKWLRSTMKKSFAESDALARRLRAEIRRRQAA